MILLGATLTAWGQTAAPTGSSAVPVVSTVPVVPAVPAVPVVMISDIHFDPFHDPAKFGQLQAAPVESWAEILGGAASPTQAADFDHLQSTCGARGVDTPMDLLQSSLAAAQKQESSPLFVTVSGDLIAHEFDCRFHTLAAHSSGADLALFVEKTIAFLALRLRQTFPQAPVYFALGNNDSGCKDYREDVDDAFLRALAESFAADVRNPANRDAILKQFPQAGDYSILLPAAIKNTRLIVLQDVFESRAYAACSGNESTAPADAQIGWLRAQLTAARAAHENVWVMGHIPPGVDAYSTLLHAHDVCGGGAPIFFLENSALADVLTSFPDVIRLALFAHTHMDETHLLQTGSGPGVAMKLVPSISPVDGNNPAFTVAEVDPRTAILKDYAVYAGSNQTGIDTTWKLEYRYSSTYGLPDVSSASVARLTSDLAANRDGNAAASRSYERFYFVGVPGDELAVRSALMRLVWPIYACTLRNTTASEYRACRCPAQGSEPKP